MVVGVCFSVSGLMRMPGGGEIQMGIICLLEMWWVNFGYAGERA